MNMLQTDAFQPVESIRPDLSHIVTEDDCPVDNRFSERQQRLLPHLLFTSWPEGKPFEALLYHLRPVPLPQPESPQSVSLRRRPLCRGVTL